MAENMMFLIFTILTWLEIYSYCLNNNLRAFFNLNIYFMLCFRFKNLHNNLLLLFISTDGCLAKLKDQFGGKSGSSQMVKKDLLDFEDAFERQLAWLLQKDKMASLLVPVNCDSSILSNQLLQTQVSVYSSDVFSVPVYILIVYAGS